MNKRQYKQLSMVFSFLIILSGIGTYNVIADTIDFTETNYATGNFEGSPIFPYNPSDIVTFENESKYDNQEVIKNTTFSTSTGSSTTKMYVMNDEYINVTGLDDRALYMYNETWNDYSSMVQSSMISGFETYDIGINAIEFDFKLYNQSQDYTMIDFQPDGLHSLSSGYGNLGNNMHSSVSFDYDSNGLNISVKYYNDYTSLDESYFFNISEAQEGIFHIAWSNSFSDENGYTQWLYIVTPDNDYLFSQYTWESVTSNPNYDATELRVYMKNRIYINDDVIPKMSIDNIKVYEEEVSVDEIQSYSKSLGKGIENILPVIVLAMIIPVLMTIMKRFE